MSESEDELPKGIAPPAVAPSPALDALIEGAFAAHELRDDLAIERDLARNPRVLIDLALRDIESIVRDALISRRGGKADWRHRQAFGMALNVVRLILWFSLNGRRQAAEQVMAQMYSAMRAATTADLEDAPGADLEQAVKKLRGELHKLANILVWVADQCPQAPSSNVPPIPDTDPSAVWNSLSFQKRNLLQALALLEAKAVGADTMWRAQDIVKKAESTAAKVNNFKKSLADLVHSGLIRSKTGRGGGYWLSQDGRKLVEANVQPDDDARR